jgi:hypothetical protein
MTVKLLNSSLYSFGVIRNLTVENKWIMVMGQLWTNKNTTEDRKNCPGTKTGQRGTKKLSADKRAKNKMSVDKIQINSNLLWTIVDNCFVHGQLSFV